MRKYLSLIFFALLLTFPVRINSQSKTNFEVVDSLVKLSIDNFSEQIEKVENYFLVFNSPTEYNIFESTLIDKFNKNEIKLAKASENEINYTLKEILTTYPEIIKDGPFGGYLVKRVVKVNGSIFFNNDNNFDDVNEFNLKSEDFIRYDDVSIMENIAYSFTSAKLPEEPLFSSTIEPIIAIGTTAAAVYLFFNIRSK